MSLEYQYPGLARQIALQRLAGYSDDEIEAQVRQGIASARATGMSNLDLGGMLAGEPVHKGPLEQTPIEQALQFVEDIGKGAASGATLGYVSPEVTPETSITGRVLGELAGGIGPGLASWGLTTPLKALQVGGKALRPALSTTLRSGAAGGILGGAAPAEDLSTRVQNTLKGLTVGTLAGAPLGIAAEVGAVNAAAARERMGTQLDRLLKPGASATYEPPTQMTFPTMREGPTPWNTLQVGEQADLTRPKTYREVGPRRAAPPPPAGPGEPAPPPGPTPSTPPESPIQQALNLLDESTGLPPEAEAVLNSTDMPPGVAPPKTTALTSEPTATPLPSPVTAQEFAAEMAFERRLPLAMEEPTVQANTIAEDLGREGMRTAAASRRAYAEARTAPQAPTRIEQPNQTVMVELPGGGYTFEPVPPPVAEAVTLKGLQALGKTRGQDITPIVGPKGVQMQVVSRGGGVRTFDTLAEANQYLRELPTIEIQPIEATVAPDGATAFDHAVAGNETPAVKVARKKQGLLFRSRKAEQVFGLEPGESDAIGQLVRDAIQPELEGMLAKPVGPKGPPALTPEVLAPEVPAPPAKPTPASVAEPTPAVKTPRAEPGPIAAGPLRDEVFGLFDEIGHPELKGKRKFSVDIVEVPEGEPMNVRPTWHDATYRYTLLRDVDGTLTQGASGSYDTILNTGAARGGSGSLRAGQTAYIIDLGPWNTREVNIYRATKPRGPAVELQQLPAAASPDLSLTPGAAEIVEGAKNPEARGEAIIRQQLDRLRGRVPDDVIQNVEGILSSNQGVPGRLALLDKVYAQLKKAEASLPPPPPPVGGPGMGPGAASIAEPMAPRAATEGPARVRFVGPQDVFGSPISSKSPTVRFVAEEVWKGAMGMRYRLSNWFKAREEALIKNLGGIDTPFDVEAFDVAQGDKVTTKPRVQAAVNFYNSMKRDFARRMGLPEWENYATHVTDFDTLLDTMRGELNKSYGQLDAAWQLKLTPGQHHRYQSILEKFKTWREVPSNLRQDIKAELFEWEDAATTWDLLPPGVKEKLPKEIFSPYMLPRVGGVPYKRSLITAFDRYVPTMEHKASFDPVMAAVRPLIESLPGANVPLSERWYLNNYIERTVLRKPSSTERVVSTLVNKTNEMLGKQLLNPDILNQAIGAWRRGVYRGALGIDSAFINLTQSLNTWAEYGRIPILRTIAKRGEIPDVPGITREFAFSVGEDVAAFSTGKLQQIDQALTRIVLSPMRMTEFINRGLAFHAGLEDAMRRGLNFTEAVKVGMGSTSQVVPNLELTAAQLEGLKGMLKTQFGYTPELASPLLQNPLARISTLFLSYPTRQLQFLANGITDAISTRASGKAARYLALTGFTFGAPLLFSQAGVDVRNTWGKGFVSLGLPAFKLVGSAYNAVLGSSPYSKEQARSDFSNAIGTMFVPQFRYGSKVERVYSNIQRGYAVDALGRNIYSTTPAGEMLRLIGVGPEDTFKQREQVRAIRSLAEEYRFDKEQAIAKLLAGDGKLAQSFMGKWGRPITASEIMKFAETQRMDPKQRAMRSLPQELRYRALQEQ